MYRVTDIDLVMRNQLSRAQSFYRSTNALHLSWYLYWYRWTLGWTFKSFVNSFTDKKGKVLVDESGGSRSGELG